MSPAENLETPKEFDPGEMAELNQWLEEWGPTIKRAYAEDPKLIPLFLPILVAGILLETPFTIEQAKLLAGKISKHEVLGESPAETDFSPGKPFFYFHKPTVSSPIGIFLGVAEEEDTPATFRLKTLPIGTVFAEEYFQPIIPPKTEKPCYYYLPPKARCLVSVDKLLLSQEKEKLAA